MARKKRSSPDLDSDRSVGAAPEAPTLHATPTILDGVRVPIVAQRPITSFDVTDVVDEDDLAKREIAGGLSAMHEATRCDLHDVGAKSPTSTAHAIRAACWSCSSRPRSRLPRAKKNAGAGAASSAPLDRLAAIPRARVQRDGGLRDLWGTRRDPGRAPHASMASNSQPPIAGLDKIMALNPGPLHHNPLQAPVPRRADGATTGKKLDPGSGANTRRPFSRVARRVPIADACSPDQAGNDGFAVGQEALGGMARRKRPDNEANRL